MVTTFMSRMFSASAEEENEVLEQTAADIEAAKKEGQVSDEDNNLVYVNLGEGVVQVTDLGHGGETTLVSQAEDGSYELEPGNPAEQSEQIEGYAHPEVEGQQVEVGQQEGAADEKVEDHLTGEDVIAPNKSNGGLNPEAGQEATVEENAETGEGRQVVEGAGSCPECKEDEKEFSVSTDNAAVLRIFSDQEYCERIFSDCIENDESVKIGSIKVEKIEGEDAVIVTDIESGDAAKVTLDEENMDVQELSQKELSKYYSEEEAEEEEDEYAGAPAQPGDESEFDAAHVVGVDAGNHIIVDAPVYSEEQAQDLVARLQEDGVQGVEVFECPSEARDYAIGLLNNLGVESEEDIEEPQQVEFSDHVVYVTRFYSNHTDYMMKVFSEAAEGVDASQQVIEDAIENGDEIEVDNEIITPIDSETAIVEDKKNGEFTKVTIDGDDLQFDAITKAEAEELVDDLAVEEGGVDEDATADNEEEKEFSEPMTAYMTRLFSEDDATSQKEIEDAIASGEQVENDNEVITPVDAETAIIEDKENGEFTKATIIDDDNIDIKAISEEEADELTKGLAVEEKEAEKAKEEAVEEEAKEEAEEDEKEEKEFSTLDKFFCGIEQPANGPELIQAYRDPKTGELVEYKPQAEEDEEAAPSLEAIEDKALQAVQSIQEAAAEASAQILEAKQAPAPEAEADLQEAQFSEKEENTESEKTFSEDNDTLISWFKGNQIWK